jgi:hypothetical protein
MNDALALVDGNEADLLEQFPWASADCEDHLGG